MCIAAVEAANGWEGMTKKEQHKETCRYMVLECPNGYDIAITDLYYQNWVKNS